MSRIRADQLVNRAGSGGPKFPNGVAEGFSVSGIVTATSFDGNVTGNADTATNSQGLTGTPNITVGTIGCGNVTSTGDVTGVNATFSGNLTVNGTTTTIDTAVTAVDSLAVDGSVGIGTTNPGNFNGNADDLVIFGTGHQGLTIRSGAAHDGSIMFNDTNNANQRGIIRYVHTDDAMAFHTSVGEALRITSTGKCEVYKGTSATGKTSGSEAFTVGNGAGNKRFSVYPDGTAVIGGQGTIANNNILLQNDGAGTFGSIDVSSTSTDGVRALGGSGQLVVQRSSGASGRAIEIYDGSTRTIDIFANGTATFAGTVSDSKGPLRNIPMNDQSSNASYTLIIGDAGKLVHASGTTSTVVVPNGVFGAGNAVTILNGDGSNTLTISQGSGFSLRNTADSSTGNRTLAVFGMATIYFTGSGVGYISGAGLS